MTSHGRKYRTVREVQSACCASRSRSFPDSRKNSRSRHDPAVIFLIERENERKRNAAIGLSSRSHIDDCSRIFLREGVAAIGNWSQDSREVIAPEISPTRDPHLSQSYRSRNLSVAHRVRPREDRFLENSVNESEPHERAWITSPPVQRDVPRQR